VLVGAHRFDGVSLFLELADEGFPWGVFVVDNHHSFSHAAPKSRWREPLRTPLPSRRLVIISRSSCRIAISHYSCVPIGVRSEESESALQVPEQEQASTAASPFGIVLQVRLCVDHENEARKPGASAKLHVFKVEVISGVKSAQFGKGFPPHEHQDTGDPIGTHGLRTRNANDSAASQGPPQEQFQRVWQLSIRVLDPTARINDYGRDDVCRAPRQRFHETL
jgi:hypothetical protein